MFADIKQTGSELIFSFIFEKTDSRVISKNERAHYGFPKPKPGLEPEEVGNEHAYFASFQDKCSFSMPENWELKKVHPDILGLSALFLVFPFIKDRLKLPFGVSSFFAEQIRIITGLEIYPVDAQLGKRDFPSSGLPILLYSGGVDSTAALALLPENTSLVYSQRKSKSDDPKDKYFSAEAAVHACNFLRSRYRNVFIIENDTEYLLRPTSNATHQTKSVPALLLADQLNADCLAIGDVLESIYRLGSGLFVDAKVRNNLRRLKLLYESVGLSYHPVTMGMSEVCTTILCEITGLAHIAESCPRAKGGKPCMACIKCFRKQLLNMAIKREFAPDEGLERYFSLPLVRRVLLSEKIKFENIYAFICERYSGNSTAMNLFRQRVLPEGRSVEWMERWYLPSANFMAEKYRDFTAEKVGLFFKPMSEKDIAAMKSFYNLHASQDNIDNFRNYLLGLVPEKEKKRKAI